jgi:hypothetical protein
MSLVAPPPSGHKARSLLDLRSDLVDVTMNPDPSGDTFGKVVARLSIVQSALDQLHTSSSVQSCSRPIKTGVASQATLTWTTIGGTGIWSLNCG